MDSSHPHIGTLHRPYIATETLISPMAVSIDARANSERWTRVNSDPNCISNCEKEAWLARVKAMDVDYAATKGYYIGLEDKVLDRDRELYLCWGTAGRSCGIKSQLGCFFFPPLT